MIPPFIFSGQLILFARQASVVVLTLLNFGMMVFESLWQRDPSADDGHLIPVLFEQLPEVNEEGSQWTDCEITDAINLVYQNLNKLDLHLSTIVSVR